MEISGILFIILGVISGLTKGAGVLPDGPLNAAVGKKVMFTTTLTPPEKPFVTLGWRFGDKNVIVFNGENFTGPEYEGRITLFMSTGSLELRNLALNDSGEYSVSIFPFGELQKGGSVRLEVLVPVSNVMATASSTDLLEFNSTVHLSCSSSGSSLSFLWLNSSSEVTASDRVQLTDGGANLTIVNVTRYDQGPFKCHVSNPVSSGTSDPINFSISYGPDNTNLTISPSQEYHEEGSNITFICSADSRPPAQFMWLINGDLLSDTGPELRLMNIQESHSGNYSCQAFNNRTLRYQTSQPAAISVLTRVANVVVTSNTTDLLEFSSSVHLSCSSSGSSPSFLWLNSSSEVTATDRVHLTRGNSTLTIVNVTRYDQGPFRCHVSSPVSNGTSDPVNLSISYGPENINLAISPSQLRLVNIQMGHNGNYSCQAANKTLRYKKSQPSVVSVLERISGASITPSTDLPIEGNAVNLTCAAAGSVFTRKWMKDGSDLIPAVNMTLHNKNRVLSFNSLNKKDTGEYSCKISNPVSNDEAKYFMKVNYGPENVQITGPSKIHLKENFTLNCSAESTPSATYTWILNGTEIHNASVFTKHNAELSDSGNYICQVMNNITERTWSGVHVLTVTDSSGVLSGGVIAVIVILCLVAPAGAVGGYYIYKKKKKINNKTPSPSDNNEEEQVYENTSAVYENI